MNSAEANLSPELYRRFTEIAYDSAGIAIRPGKETLVAARVARRMLALKLPTPEQYREYLESDKTGAELVHFLNAISTNTTSFFREKEHFDRVRSFVEDRLRGGQRRLRMWSAACSSGEEPYTLAMVVADVVGSANVDWRILATDISTQVLSRAAAGLYEPKVAASVPANYRKTYFRDGPDGTVEVDPALRSHIVFHRLNLSRAPYGMPGPLDLVMCRNVMIYFDDVVRQRILVEASRLLAPGGLFFTSHTESLASLSTDLRMESPSVYVKESKR